MFIASEVVPVVAAWIDGHVSLNTDQVVRGGCAIEGEHLGYNGIDLVGRVVSNDDVFRIEELTNRELPILVG